MGNGKWEMKMRKGEGERERGGLRDGFICAWTCSLLVNHD
jgi:hypothetical protein